MSDQQASIPMMASQKTIADLTDRNLYKIFDLLALEDVLFSVAKVCSRWSAIAPIVCLDKKKLFLYPGKSLGYFAVAKMHFLEMAPSCATSSNLLVLDQGNNRLVSSLPDKFDSLEELSIYHGGSINNYDDLSSMLHKCSSTLVTLKIDFAYNRDYSEQFFKQLCANGQCLLPKLESLSICNTRTLANVPFHLITGQLEVLNLHGWHYGDSYESLCAMIKHIDQVAPAILTLKHLGFAGDLHGFHQNLKRAGLLGSRIPLKRLSLVSAPGLCKQELADICRFYPNISYLSLEIYGPFSKKEVLTAIVPLRHNLRRLKILSSVNKYDYYQVQDVWMMNPKDLSAFQVQFELVQSVRLVTRKIQKERNWSQVSSIRDFSKHWSNVGATDEHPLYSEISRIFPKAKFYTSF